MKGIIQTAAGRREFLKAGFAAAFAAAFPARFAAALAAVAPAAAKGLTAAETALLGEILAKLDEVNPVDPKTGARSCISFGFITDVHKCKRVEGDDVPKFADCRKDYYYWGSLTESEPTIRLLGAAAQRGGLDAVFHGGDFSTGNSSVALTDQEYIDEIALVKAMFAAHMGPVPYFTVDGNHDRCYKTQHVMSDEAWAPVLRSFNCDVRGSKTVDLVMENELAAPTVGPADAAAGKRYTGSSFYVDLKRLAAKGGRMVRLGCASLYDKCAGARSVLRFYDAINFYGAAGALLDPAKTPENTVIGFLAHDAEAGAAEIAGTMFLNASSRCGNSTAKAKLVGNLGQHRGAGFLGMIAGHAHQSLVKHIKGSKASCVQVANAFGTRRSSKIGQGAEVPPGAFSIFTVDTAKGLLWETRLLHGKVENRSTELATGAKA